MFLYDIPEVSHTYKGMSGCDHLVPPYVGMRASGAARYLAVPLAETDLHIDPLNSVTVARCHIPTAPVMSHTTTL